VKKKRMDKIMERLERLQKALYEDHYARHARLFDKSYLFARRLAELLKLKQKGSVVDIEEKYKSRPVRFVKFAVAVCIHIKVYIHLLFLQRERAILNRAMDELEKEGLGLEKTLRRLVRAEYRKGALGVDQIYLSVAGEALMEPVVKGIMEDLQEIRSKEIGELGKEVEKKYKNDK
jgi:hypothetical protein